MPQRRRTYSILNDFEVQPYIEDREPESTQISTTRRRRVTFQTVIHQDKERKTRSRSAHRRQRQRSLSFSPPRRLPSPFLENTFSMSPTDSPKTGTKKFVPLPKPLPQEKEPKTKTKAEKPSHKSRPSLDSGYGAATPPYYEERSPDQYSPGGTKIRKSDLEPYERVETDSSGKKYVYRNGKAYRIEARKPSSPLSGDYVPGPPDTPLPARKDSKYKKKFREAQQTAMALQGALEDTTATAQHNYKANLEQETRLLSAAEQIEKLEAKLRKVTLQAQILESQAKESERMLMENRRRREVEDLTREIDYYKQLELERKAEELKLKQWAEIEAKPSPVLKTRRLPVIDQQRPPRQSLVRSSYGSQNATSNVFTDPLDEAADDYDRTQASTVQFASSDRRGRDRREPVRRK